MDFYLATRVVLKRHNSEQDTTVAQQAKFFAPLARRVATLSQGLPTPCKPIPWCGALAPFGDEDQLGEVVAQEPPSPAVSRPGAGSPVPHGRRATAATIC